MVDFRLPDVKTISDAESKNSVSKITTQDSTWDEARLVEWLNSNNLAPWVPQWVSRLSERCGTRFPELFRNNLDDEKNIPQWMQLNSTEPVWLSRFLGRTDLLELWLEEGFLKGDPLWLEHLIRFEETKVARSFLLTGNIADYAFDPERGFRPATRLLVDTLTKIKGCVLTFSLSQGLSIHSQEPNACDRLPDMLQQELGNTCWIGQGTLMTAVCRLFEEINRWLLGNDESTKDEPDSSIFTKGVAIIFENVHLIIPPDSAELEHNFLVDNLLRWSSSPELFRGPHCLILIAESLDDVANSLRASGGKIEQIHISRPDRAEARLKFLIPLLDPDSEMNETRVCRLQGGIAQLQGYEGKYQERIRMLGQDTAGLNLMGIEDLIQQNSVHDCGELNREKVMQMKRERLRQESDGLIEVMDPKHNLDQVGGYVHLKSRLKEVTRAMRYASDFLVKRTLPMGILFLGPPGTGKSFMAEALAAESGVSMAKLGNFRGMYVGQSERNLSRIFELIEALHPVIIFIDEIDQALGQRGSQSADSGVDNRIFGQFLEFMSMPEHRGKILWVGASNYPNNIDSALKRAGRFDLLLPFLLPDRESRKEIIRVQLNSALKNLPNIASTLTEPDLDEIASQTVDYSGAELETIVNEVLRRLSVQSTLGEGVTIDLSAFKTVLDVYRPPEGQRQAYKTMEKLAIREISFTDLIPKEAQDLLSS